MALSDKDRELLARCLSGDESAWSTFVERFMPLVTHVVNYAADCRAIHLSASDREDLIAEIFVVLLDDDMRVLRHFQQRSSLATYLAVVSRRVAMRRIMHPTTRRLKGKHLFQSGSSNNGPSNNGPAKGHVSPPTTHAARAPHTTNHAEPIDQHQSVEERISNQEQVELMLGGLAESEAKAIRLFHLEGKSYREISLLIGISENTIGPLLSRTRELLRRRAGLEGA